MFANQISVHEKYFVKIEYKAFKKIVSVVVVLCGVVVVVGVDIVGGAVTVVGFVYIDSVVVVDSVVVLGIIVVSVVLVLVTDYDVSVLVVAVALRTLRC